MLEAPYDRAIGLAQSDRLEQSEILEIDHGPIQDAAQSGSVQSLSATEQDSGIHDGKQIEKGVGAADAVGEEQQQCYEEHIPDGLQVDGEKDESSDLEGEVRQDGEQKGERHQPDDPRIEEISGRCRLFVAQQYG